LRRSAHAVLAATIGVVCLAAPSPANAQGAAAPPRHPAREVLAFAPYWALGQERSWDYRLLTTVAYFGVDIRGDGGIDTSAANHGWRGWNSQQLVQLIGDAHRHGVRVDLVVKQFDSDQINALVTSRPATQAAIGNIVRLLAARGLDGVNVDLEGHTTSEHARAQAGMTSFLAQLTARVHAWRRGATVTVDTNVGSAGWDDGLFDIRALAPHVDAFFVMAYDMVFKDLCCRAGPNAPLHPYPPYDVSDAVRQYLAKAPPSKIILGMPLYGYKWSTKGDGPNSETTSPPEPDGYASALADVRCVQDHRLHVSGPHWDATAGSHWIAWYSPATGDPCGGNRGSWRELYYEDAASIGLKLDLVNARGLEGAGLWALGYQGQRRELWDVIGQRLGGAAGVLHRPPARAHAGRPAPQPPRARSSSVAPKPAARPPAPRRLGWRTQANAARTPGPPPAWLVALLAVLLALRRRPRPAGRGAGPRGPVCPRPTGNAASREIRARPAPRRAPSRRTSPAPRPTRSPHLGRGPRPRPPRT
jgi:hypothetical protein